MSRDEAAKIVFLVGTLAIAAERGLSGLLKVSHLRPAQFRLLLAVHLEARRRLIVLANALLRDRRSWTGRAPA
ncbi:MAG: hypothetical protein OXQ29_08350 [Rhodospirillaceae bacterium]|nr:hypothetical protein [Rhodospirillaceae bacterium]